MRGEAILSALPSSGKREDDIIDVGIVELEPMVAECQHIQWIIPFDRFKTGLEHVGSKVYMAIGYPATRINRRGKSISPQAMIYWNLVADAALYKKKGLSPQSHILITYDQEHSTFQDGKEGSTPDPHGMSGCPIWLLGDIQDAAKNDPGVIVGIATEHDRRNKCIVATDIAYALTNLNDLIAK